MLKYEPHFAAVFFADEGPRAPICFFGINAVVHDDFLREIKGPAQFWFGPELARRIVKGESSLLTDKQLREANSGHGLNLLCWEGLARSGWSGYEGNSELHHYMMAKFIQIHQGYLWKEVIANQAESADRLLFFLQTGAAFWDPLIAAYTSELRKKRSPRTRRQSPCSWQDPRSGTPGAARLGRKLGGRLFDYRFPTLGFSLSEQRLLSSALLGTTDEQLAEMLKSSLPAVKKMWVSIYRRAAECLPELLPGSIEPDIPAGGRGKEKRRGLLAYLREHPEELRPISRKLLSKARMEMRATSVT